MNGPRILIIRLGSMGDVIHTLPAVASLKHSIPHSRITWLIEPRWSPLLEGNPYVDSLIFFDRHTLSGLRQSWKALRSTEFDFVVDFQGLIKSALIASMARAERIYGFDAHAAREPVASWFYSNPVSLRGYHAVDRNLDLATAAGATSLLHTFPLPEGRTEGELPRGPFVLACPLAGWGAKQWPLEYYSQLAAQLNRELGLPLVLNAPQRLSVEGTWPHASSLMGLIDATRKAIAVVGVDSGPLHLAAALGKPGVGIYGPTEPARHGPYGGTIRVLRLRNAAITYRRSATSHQTMRDIDPDTVFSALEQVLQPELKLDRRR